MGTVLYRIDDAGFLCQDVNEARPAAGEEEKKNKKKIILLLLLLFF